MSTVSYSPYDGRVLGELPDTESLQLREILNRAAAAAPEIARTAPAERQRWLNAIADALEENREELALLADHETALGAERMKGEVSRAAGQLRFYARVAVDGAYLGATLDDATPTSPRLVRVSRPLGPVAVFGASNFPFAFGVLGNDTASALAAGCPVVAKAHPAHMLTCLRLAEIARLALAAAGAPDGTYDMVSGFQAGADLVKADAISAVGFTGSQGGGMALWRIANERAIVIPVFAEMGTVNPIVMTPGAAERVEAIAEGFVGSFTLGAGQFCSKPGLLFAPLGSGAADAVAHALRYQGEGKQLLTRAIAENYAAGLADLQAAGAVVVERIAGPGEGWTSDSVVMSAPITALTAGSRLLQECFGPVALVIEYADLTELDDALATLQGSLAAAVFGRDADDPDVATYVARLAEQVGRVTVGDWTTGVPYSWAQHHGGPWPATSAPAATSVGAGALERFVRPVAFQSVPDAALPDSVGKAISPENPWRIVRRINGEVQVPQPAA